MILPENAEKLERFWINFSQAMKKVTRLQSIKMYQCPSFVVESIIESLPQLVVFNAMQIKYNNISYFVTNHVFLNVYIIIKSINVLV